MNYIKDDTRNSIETTTLQYHMIISINGPSFEEVETFGVEDAIGMWRDKKPRRFAI
jgi:hypothetical protein